MLGTKARRQERQHSRGGGGAEGVADADGDEFQQDDGSSSRIYAAASLQEAIAELPK